MFQLTDSELPVMMEEYPALHSESLNKDVLCSHPLAVGGREGAACGTASSWAGATELNGCHEAGSGLPL